LQPAPNLLYGVYCLLLTWCMQWVPEAHVSLDELQPAPNLLYGVYCLLLTWCMQWVPEAHVSFDEFHWYLIKLWLPSLFSGTLLAALRASLLLTKPLAHQALAPLSLLRYFTCLFTCLSPTN
jgi:hypothetical protein